MDFKWVIYVCAWNDNQLVCYTNNIAVTQSLKQVDIEEGFIQSYCCWAVRSIIYDDLFWNTPENYLFIHLKYNQYS